MIGRLNAKIKFTRKLGEEEYPSPGGYEAVMKDGRTFAFDFYESCSGEDKMDASIWEYSQRDPDTDAFPGIPEISFKDFVENFEYFEDFYLDTEGCGPDLYPEKLLELAIEFTEPDGGIYTWTAPKDVLDAVTEKFHEELERDGFEAE